MGVVPPCSFTSMNERLFVCFFVVVFFFFFFFFRKGAGGGANDVIIFCMASRGVGGVVAAVASGLTITPVSGVHLS